MNKLFFTILALLVLTGCSLVPLPPETEPAPTGTAPAPTEAPETEPPKTEPPAPEPGLYDLYCYTSDGAYRPQTIAVRGSEVVVMLCDIDASGEGFAKYVQYLDLDASEAGPIIALENSEDTDYYMLSAEADGSLILYDPYAATAARYDRSGRLLGSIDNPYRTGDSFQFPHELATDWFTYQDDYAYYHCYADSGYLFSAYAFADEPEALYLTDGGWDSVRSANGRVLMETSYLRDNAGLSYRVLDVENARELDRLTIENDAVGDERENVFLNEMDAVFCEEGAVLRVDRTRYDPNVAYGEEGPEPDWEQHIYLWRFDEAAEQPVEVRRVTAEELNSENENTAARIGERYEINVLLDVVPEGDTPPIMEGDDPEAQENATLITGITPLQTYELLLHLERFLELLPEGFTHEMQTDYPPTADQYGLTGFDGFDIYVIKEIPGLSSAYANGWGDRLKIVFAADEFTTSTVPHEFMHLIERRVTAYYESVGENFWDEWESLNPEDFDYFDEEDHNDLVGDWFVSSYAMTDSMEDRAETFMEVFTAQQPLEECWWYQDAPHVQAKVAYLLEAIRRSYPSVQAVGHAYWENKCSTGSGEETT